jgi:hypothetical protein
MSATVRLDLPKGLAADLHKWSWEARTDYDKKEGKPEAEEIAEIKSMKEIKGSYYQSTTAIAASQLGSKTDYGISPVDTPIEGFTVYGAKKQTSLKTAVSAEVAKDWFRTADFLKTYVKENVPEMIYNTKNSIVMEAINNGGVAAGGKIFDNNSTDANIPSQTANLPYDGVSWFNTTHTNKQGTTFDNTLTDVTSKGVVTGAANGITLANAMAMYVKFAGTNALKENGSRFENTKDIRILASINGALDWSSVINSTLNPDGSGNAASPISLMGKIKEVKGTNLMQSSTMSLMYRKKGLKLFLSEPQYEYWEEKEPDKFWFRISLDYILVMDNWRFACCLNPYTSTYTPMV